MTDALGLRGAVSSLLDERVGIVSVLREQKRQPEDPDFFRFVASACNTSAFCEQENFTMGAGAAIDRETAALKAVGEAVERYCAAQYSKAELPLSSAALAPVACADPASFALFSPGQYEDPAFPFAPFTRETAIRWAPATDALLGERVHVPACLVYIPYEADPDEGEARIAQTISTGLALHCSYEKAAISGIGEAIERDAFMIAWQAKLSPPRIRLDTLSERNLDLVRRFEAVGDTIHILDLTLDHGVCTALAVRLSDAPSAPALGVAASTDLDPEVAVRKSLEELAHTSRYMWAIKAGLSRIESEEGHPGVRTQLGHLRYWIDAAALPEAEFLWSGESECDFNSLPDRSGANPKEDLLTLAGAMESVGLRTYLADVTSADVADLGLYVVRALVPGLHPLAMGYALRALGGERLWTVPQKLGYPGLRRGGPDNPAPHPYP